MSLPINRPSVIPVSTLIHCRKREPYISCSPWQIAPTYLCGGPGLKCLRYSPCKCRGSNSKECSNGREFHRSGKALLKFKWELKLVLLLYNGVLLYVRCLDSVFCHACFVYRNLANHTRWKTRMVDVDSNVNITPPSRQCQAPDWWQYASNGQYIFLKWPTYPSYQCKSRCILVFEKHNINIQFVVGILVEYTVL